MSNSKITLKIVRLLSETLTPAQLQAIGKITLLWNSAEAEMQKLIWVGARIDDTVGEFVTADMNNIPRIQIIRNIAFYYANKKPKALTYIQTAIDLYDEARIARNAIVHGLPVLKTDSAGVTHVEKKTARKALGRVQTSQSDISIERLDDFIECLEDTIFALQSASFMLNGLQLEDIGAARSQGPDDPYEPAQRIKLPAIQARVESLRRLHNRGAPQFQAQSPEA